MKDSTAKKESSFSGQIGFILAAAGSAVGVGNLWRFPYLAAKDGGGIFIVIYLILAVTFGFTLLTTDISIGRKTGKSSIHAYESMRPKWKFLGVLTFIVPAVIMTYYAVIGGWISKYIVVYLAGDNSAAASDDYFTGFITNPFSVIYGLVFLMLTSFIVYNGVQGGIERSSKIVMPALLVMIIGISVYSMTLSHETADGTVRTGLDGLKVYLIPDLTGLTLSKFLQITLDAMSQLFFSLSVSMGIMITYGSYVKKDIDLNRSVTQIEVFDTGVALLAGMMIVPTIFVFSGTEGMASGPSLMFVSLPKVFDAMGGLGRIIGFVFFIMTGFAALTSSVSVLEAVTANCMELFNADRKKVTLILTVFYLIATAVIGLGYSLFYVEVPLPTGGTGQLLDIMDYISNNFLMPLASILTAILVGWIVKPEWVIDEIESSGCKFGRKKLFIVMIKYIVPVVMVILFAQSTGLLSFFSK